MDEEQHESYEIEGGRGGLRGWLRRIMHLLDALEMAFVAVVIILALIAATIGLLLKILRAV
jgi:hypothetical protein